MVIILAFFVVFMYQILGSVMICNLLYYFSLLKEILLKGSVSIYKNIRVKIWLSLFLLWATVSTVVYSIDTNELTIRNIIQYIFTLQYFVWIVRLNIDWKKFDEYIFKFSLIMSVLIIVMYFATGQFIHIGNMFTTGRMWGTKFFPGWPNTTPVPLLFALFIGLKNSKSKVANSILIIGLVMTTSRGALLGIVSILAYFIFKKVKNKHVKIIVFTVPILLFGIIFSREFLPVIYHYVPSLEYRMSLSYDRQDIMKVTFGYFKLRPLLGFGGNTIDQIIVNYGNLSDYGINWGHSHNWVFETLLRYGAVGLFLFVGLLRAIFKSIKIMDNKFMFILVLVLGLFQTYLRNFGVILLIVYIMASDYDQKKMSLKEVKHEASN